MDALEYINEDVTETAYLLEYLQSKLKRIKDFKRYNKIDYFEPFEYQRKFMNAGSKYKVRYLRAGNRKQA